MSAWTSKLAAVSKTTHATKRWLRYADYKFAATQALAPLVTPELAKATTAFPIGFVTSDESVNLVALLGLKAGQNLYVAPDGRWLGSYIPAVFRTYPFRLVDNGAGGTLLGVVEDESVVSEGAEGEAFFTEDGALAPRVQEVATVLQNMAQYSPVTAAAGALLRRHGLLVPWRIRRPGEQDPFTLSDVAMVDEVALNALPADALVELRDGGGLALAYAQLLSQQHVQTLFASEAAHANAQEAARTVVNSKGELDLEFLNRSQTLDFSGLKG